MTSGWTAKDVVAIQLRRAQQPRSKYRSRKTTLDGITFDSAKEAKRYVELKAMQLAGEIRDLQWQVPFELHAPTAGDDECIGRYFADFTYRTKDNRYVVEDVKGWKTLPLARWKQKHLLAEYGIQVQEIR